MASFGRRLKAAREKRGFSIRDLAAIAGVDIGWISRLENEQRHNISLHATIRLADALRVTLDALVGRSVKGVIVEKEPFLEKAVADE